MVALVVVPGSRREAVFAALGGGPCRGATRRRELGVVTVDPRDGVVAWGVAPREGEMTTGRREVCGAVRRDVGVEGRTVGVDRRGAVVTVRLGVDREGAAVRREGEALRDWVAVRRDGAADRLVARVGFRAGCARRAGAGEAERDRVCCAARRREGSSSANAADGAAMAPSVTRTQSPAIPAKWCRFLNCRIVTPPCDWVKTAQSAFGTPCGMFRSRKHRTAGPTWSCTGTALFGSN